MRKIFGSLTGGGALLIRRRVARDAGLLVAWTLLVAFAMALAVASPRSVVEIVDGAAQEAVAKAGTNADILVSLNVGEPRMTAPVPVVSPTDAQQLAKDIIDRVPVGVHRVLGSSILSVVGPSIPASAVDGVARPTNALPLVRVGMLTAANRSHVTLVEGRLPGGESEVNAPVEVAISPATAKVASLKVGSELTVPDFPSADVTVPGNTITLKVVGLVRQSGGKWNELSEVWDPTAIVGTAPAITVLSSPAGISAASQSYEDPFSGTITLQLDPSKFTAGLVTKVSGEAEGLQANPEFLVSGTSFTIQARSDFAPALSAFPGQARAALAQMSIMIAGLLGVAAVVLVLVSRLLVLRRAGEIALERARGASLASIALRAFIESAITGALGAAIGWFAGMALQPGKLVTVLPVVAVLLVAVIAAPAQAVLASRGLWAARRAPANRRDRQQLATNANSRRIAVELTLVALAAAALVSLGSRGLLQTSTDALDPLLASAPLLLAVAITLLALRVYRFPVRLVGRFARRSRGASGLVGAVRAEKSVTILPLLSLSLAVAITVTGGVLTQTVLGGQVDASWSRVGADARVQARISPAIAETVGAASGVRVAATARAISSVQLSLGPTNEIVTVLAIDKNYPRLVDALPRTLGDYGAPAGEGVRTLGKLATADTSSSDAIPVVVDSELARLLVSKNLSAVLDGEDFPLKVIGTTNVHGPDGYLFGPYVYLDLTELAQRNPKSVGANTLLAVGPGAAAAVATQNFSKRQIDTRAGWLAERQHLGLVRGVQQTVLLSAAAVALLALIALITTVVASSRERVRSVSLLRTLGARPRIGWWLALAELAPTVVAAMLAGLASGILFVSIMVRTLGLRNLTGGLLPPTPAVSPTLVAGLIAASVLLLVVAVLTEILVHRRDRLSDVLRVGETV